jgi:hypothetical protein
MLVLSSPTKETLQAAINKFYYSDNYFINSDNRAENKKTFKIIGEIKKVKNRYQFHI